MKTMMMANSEEPIRSFFLLPTILLILLIELQTGQGENLPSECMGQNHREILNQWKRALRYEANLDDTTFCDSNLIAGWYRFRHTPFQSHVDIPDTAPQGNWFCNTLYPIYLAVEDPYPEPNNSVSVPLCIYVGANQTCNMQKDFNVTITNCGGFNVYYLKATPSSCDIAYCFGDGLPCPEGQNSLTASQPGCTDNIPQKTGIPTVKWLDEEPIEQSDLLCNVAVSDDNVTYLHVNWHVTRASDIYKHRVLVHEQPNLNRSDWPPNLALGDWYTESVIAEGLDVTCQVAAKYSNEIPGPGVISLPFDTSPEVSTTTPSTTTPKPPGWCDRHNPACIVLGVVAGASVLAAIAIMLCCCLLDCCTVACCLKTVCCCNRLSNDDNNEHPNEENVSMKQAEHA